MNITVLDGYPLNPGDVSWTPLQNLGNLVIYQQTKPEEIAERVKDADIVLTNKTPLGKRELPFLKNCRMIGVLATGTNILDLPAISAAGITVANVPGYGVEDVAEQALALLMELCRGAALHSEGVKEGEWGRRGWCYWKKAPVALAGKVLGIIGFGAIGQIMGRYGSALGMTVLANANHRTATAPYPFTYCSKEEIWAQADVISLHCPLTPETHHLINRTSIAAMKPGAIIINTARGPLIDETAAAEALKTGALGGLGADVLGVEPPAMDNPLLSAPNTVITPHMAWATTRARQKIIDMTAENIAAFLSGDPIHKVN